MTWIRWDVHAPRHELVGAIAEGLGIRKAEALGLFNAVCCGFGEYRKDGRADQVTDTTLEDWANWEGKKGRFAEVFRSRCVEQRAGQRDAPGAIKGWWRQQLLLERQIRDAARHRLPAKPQSHKKSIGNPQETRTGNVRVSEGKSVESEEKSTGDPWETRTDFVRSSRGTVVNTTLLEESRSLSGGESSSGPPSGPPPGSAARAAPPPRPPPPPPPDEPPGAAQARAQRRQELLAQVAQVSGTRR